MRDGIVWILILEKVENIFWEKWKKRSVEIIFWGEKVENCFWEKWKKRSVEARADAYSRLKKRTWRQAGVFCPFLQMPLLKGMRK